jgi:hypothetical protein
MKTKILIILSILGMGIANAQDMRDVYSPFIGFNQYNGPGAAIGGATVAAGMVIPAFTQNPANLGLHRYRIIQAWQNDSEFQSGSQNLPQSRFGGLQLIFPFPVYQGSLVAGFDFSLQSEYALAYKETDLSLRQEGGLYQLRGGLSTEFAKNLFIGADIKFLFGKNEMNQKYLDFGYPGEFYLNPAYHGVTGSIGLVQRILPMLNWGLSVELPTPLRVEEDFRDSYYINDSTLMVDKDTYEYRVSKPAVFHIGAALFLNYLDLFYEAEYTNWKNLKLTSDFIDIDGLPWDPKVNTEIETQLVKSLAHHAGIALHPPVLPLHLYGGYQLIPYPEPGMLSDDKRESYHFGLSYVIQRQISLAYQYQRYFWKYEGLDENWTQQSLNVILHF